MYAVKTIQTKKLVSTFYKSNGKKHNLTVKNPTVDKSAEEIREALELLTTLDIFEEEDGGKPLPKSIPANTLKPLNISNSIQSILWKLMSYQLHQSPLKSLLQLFQNRNTINSLI